MKKRRCRRSSRPATPPSCRAVVRPTATSRSATTSRRASSTARASSRPASIALRRQHARDGARRHPQARRDGREVHRRDRADAGARTERCRRSRCCKAVVDEGKKAGVFVQVHAVSSPAMMAGIDAGVQAVRPPAQQELRQQGRSEEAGRRRREDPDDRPDSGRRSSACSPTTTSRASATASPGPKRIVDGVRSGRGSRLHDGERADDVGSGRHRRLLHRHDLRSAGRTESRTESAAT